MDIIFVLENGKLVETGTHDELLTKKGLIIVWFKHREGDGASEAFSIIHHTIFETV